VAKDAFILELRELSAAITRLASAMEISLPVKPELAEVATPRYQSDTVEDVIDEETMAGELGIPKRTLARYRREGRFPNCWIKNSRRVRWERQKTLATWKRGIA
jgi:hypothetical protein